MKEKEAERLEGFAQAAEGKKDSIENEMLLDFSARSQNEAFARVAVAAFVTPLNPTLEEIADIKTAVSEAVTNAIIHGYEYPEKGKENIEGNFKGNIAQEPKVRIHCMLQNNVLQIEIIDWGKGIEDVEKAMEPLFTTKPERSGMGFAFMEAFMDELEVTSRPGAGTRVWMEKRIGANPWTEGGE